jgi:uncharacterized protein (TIGR03086 family)
MSTPSPWAADPGHPPPRLAGAELLGRAVDYTRGSLLLVADARPDARTPCERWDLLALLRHMVDSLAAFTEAAEIGYVDLLPVPVAGRGPVPELVDALRNRACALLAAWTHHPGVGPVGVADRELRSDLVAAAGALEIAVHGWDVAQAAGDARPLPEDLAVRLYGVALAVTDPDERGPRFGPPVPVPRNAPTGTHLLALLGRRDVR